MRVEKAKRQCNYKVTSKTLDLRHHSQMDEFRKNKADIDTHRIELEKMNAQLSNYLNSKKEDLKDEDFLNIIDIKDGIVDLERKIEKLDKNECEIDYLMNTGSILFDYYNLLENSNAPNLIPSKKIQVNSDTAKKKKCVVDFFTMKTSNNNDNSATAQENESNDVGGVISINENNRAELLERYLRFTDNNYIDNAVNKTSNEVCSVCGEGKLEFLPSESIMCCVSCHAIEKHITENEKPSYKDPPKEISYFSYKRINHYTEWLNQIQGKETTDIPDEIFENIMKELKKERITDLKKVTHAKIKMILKKMKANKYYEHCPYILNRISGNPNPHLSPELEEKLKSMFKEIQVPFLKFSPLNRKNFLSYSYCIHKFIQLLGQTEYLRFFPLLKSREKLHQQEQIWKRITEDLGWEFIRSI